MQGLCAEKNTIGLRKRLIAALYSRSPTKNSRIVIRRIDRFAVARPNSRGELGILHLHRNAVGTLRCSHSSPPRQYGV